MNVTQELPAVSGDSITDRYERVRLQSIDLCAPLQLEDYQVQPMDDASPPKWHLAHVTWFFETFILKRELTGYAPFHDAYEVLFNSYYNGVGEQYPRAKRGLLSRPALTEVLAYRDHVDELMNALLSGDVSDDLRFTIELGLNHEQQHQELILADLKYNLGSNPLKPAYIDQVKSKCQQTPLKWTEFSGGEQKIGTDGNEGFVFDNEKPRHSVLLTAFALANRPVSNGEYLEFIEDGGYARPELWLSDGWTRLQEAQWQAPLYWRKTGNDWAVYALTGESLIDPDEPVCHVSAYEADAYARWKGCRLPTEAEWEVAAAGLPATKGNFAQSGQYHPRGAQGDDKGLIQMFGDVWEWTSSSYGAYPGFRAFAGQLGEYNGKFMANQLVLRGGSCATPEDHVRLTYRNFFYPPDRWQFSGIRLATDLSARSDT